MKNAQSNLSAISLKVTMVLCCALLAVQAHAHVKWFVVHPDSHYYMKYPLDLLSGLIVLGALLFIVFAVLIDKKSEKIEWINTALHAPIAPGFSEKIPVFHHFLKLSMALLLLSNLLQGHFVAPNFVADPTQMHYVALQAGLLLILVLDVSWFAVSLLLACLLIAWTLPLTSTIDYLPELMAIGLAMWFFDAKRKEKIYRVRLLSNLYALDAQSIGLTLLRIGLGVQLMILTIHDKLSGPAYGLAFLADYPFINFLHYYFGWEFFSDIYFILAAGLAEFCFGLLLVANLALRLSLVLILFFFTLTGIVLDIHELLGHLPIIAASLVLFIQVPNALLKKTANQKIHLSKEESGDSLAG